MPIFNLKRDAPAPGTGWTEKRLREAWKLVLNADLDIDPSTMSHADFCKWWADYRLEQLK